MRRLKVATGRMLEESCNFNSEPQQQCCFKLLQVLFVWVFFSGESIHTGPTSKLLLTSEIYVKINRISLRGRCCHFGFWLFELFYRGFFLCVVVLLLWEVFGVCVCVCSGVFFLFW